MFYEGTIYRPPSEAGSLLVQVTIGCAWNRCTFCDMYKEKKFRIRPLEDIKADLLEAVPYANRIRRIFLCDGDAFVLPTAILVELLEEIRRLYPKLEGVRIYGTARDILRKTPEELTQLKNLGLEMIFIGLESGSDQVLTAVNKGSTKQQMIDAAALLRAAGIKQSVTIIAGLGGEELMREHILETADALNHMQPEYLGMLVLYVGGEAAMMSSIRDGSFRLPSPQQVLAEMKLLLENLELKNCYFTSAHVSNYIHVKGQLPEDREELIALIDGLEQQ